MRRSSRSGGSRGITWRGGSRRSCARAFCKGGSGASSAVNSANRAEGPSAASPTMRRPAPVPLSEIISSDDDEGDEEAHEAQREREAEQARERVREAARKKAAEEKACAP
mmetsp:Transcript_11852/g.37817  ORF Transcript_11852/g.37817 Transcript_11852/m.37817 type:complete len:110 (-) Transcript_11852:72-401(-)